MSIKGFTLIALLTAAAVLGPPAQAQQGPFCSSSMLSGTYLVTCSGWTSLAPGAPLVPMMHVGTSTGDADGNWTGSTVINIGGQVVIPDAKVSGKAVVNSDCTGSVTYTKGTPGELNISFVYFKPAEEIHGLVVDKGSVLSCVLKRISK